MDTRRTFWIVMLLHTSFSAGTYIFGKAATAHIPVLALGLLRFVLGSLGFLALLGVRKYPLRAMLAEDRSGFLLAGMLGVLVNQIGFLWGLKLTLPSHAALLYALTPTVVLLQAWLRGSERPTRTKSLGIAVAFSGVLVLFLGEKGTALPASWLWGDLLVLLAVFAWAAFTLQTRPLILKYGAEAATTLSVLLGTAMFVHVGLIGLVDLSPSSVPLSAWLGLLYLGIITTVVMYLLWFHALSLREPSRVAIVQNGQPVLTALLAWAVFGTQPSPVFWLGTGLVITGVLVTQR